MIRLSTILTTFLILLTGLVSLLGAQELPWPLEYRIDIYHGFGEFRPNRYHAGVDLRTGGKEGRKVFSPIDGYVYRVKMSYRGYGKGLYLMGDDGKIYVFGHLKDFLGPIDGAVKAIQLAKKRYYIDHYFPKDSLRIEAGELIALSGKTGSGAPHLHFEVRATENLPVNPLLNGFSLPDTVAPILERIGFQFVDSGSLFSDGSRIVYWPLVDEPASTIYSLTAIPYFSAPFGLLIDGFDKNRARGIKNAVYRMSLEVDGEPRYDLVFDTLAFDQGRSVNLNYDYAEAVEGKKRVRRLFGMIGNDLSGATSYNSDRGIWGLGDRPQRITRHRAVVKAEDATGNSSRAEFDFFWGPQEIFNLDSTNVLAWDTTFFYFSPAKGYETLEVDSVVDYMNSQDEWGRVKNSRIIQTDDGSLRLEVYGGAAETYTMRLVLYTPRGLITDEPFVGIFPNHPKAAEIDWKVVPGGLSVKVSTRNVRGAEFYLRLFNEGELLGVFLPSKFVSMREIYYFVPADRRFSRIDLFDLSPESDRETTGKMNKIVDIRLIGAKRKETTAVDESFSIMTGRDDFYEPVYISLQKRFVENRLGQMLNSDIYQIWATSFVTRKSFEVSLTMDSTAKWPGKTGLCWYNDKDSSWVWLKDNARDGDRLVAQSMGGGMFAAKIDRHAPTVKALSIRRNQVFSNPSPQVRFQLSDSLSGIEDDRSIKIFIDDEWLIPEYDPESEICIAKPNQPLEDGDHQLRLEITDRAGNVSRQKIKFSVKVYKRGQ